MKVAAASSSHRGVTARVELHETEDDGPNHVRVVLVLDPPPQGYARIAFSSVVRVPEVES